MWVWWTLFAVFTVIGILGFMFDDDLPIWPLWFVIVGLIGLVMMGIDKAIEYDCKRSAQVQGVEKTRYTHFGSCYYWQRDRWVTNVTNEDERND